MQPPAVDPMTGLPRRDVLRQRLVEDCERARRLGDSLSLLAIDLDHFREVNSQHLLPGGDQILIQMARLLAQHARPCDLVVRDGGDQFTVVLYGADRDVAMREAERLRAIIAATPFVVRSNPLAPAHVTASVGIATLTANDAEAWQIFERARTAVHEAKARGRNCSVNVG